MAIILSTELPVDVDTENKEQLHEYLILLKQIIEEIRDKAQEA